MQRETDTSRKYGTLLRAISTHGLWVECRACGHGAELRVSDLLEVAAPDAAVRDILPRLECKKCREKEIGDVVILSPDVGNKHQGGWQMNERERQPDEQ
ncbi:hypothetical protein [Ruegeria sp. HKCCD8929]|uniref:hypothetical protein n=1 Tax=Ruegeria sp. HKCCD8929 TaxID=2683006 RepID=UPI0014898D98|nr:hypothetical protein [Ruegeria sp. HKCCD8929]